MSIYSYVLIAAAAWMGCQADRPPVAPAGKATGDDLASLFRAFEQAQADTAAAEQDTTAVAEEEDPSPADTTAVDTTATDTTTADGSLDREALIDSLVQAHSWCLRETYRLLGTWEYTDLYDIHRQITIMPPNSNLFYVREQQDSWYRLSGGEPCVLDYKKVSRGDSTATWEEGQWLVQPPQSGDLDDWWTYYWNGNLITWFGPNEIHGLYYFYMVPAGIPWARREEVANQAEAFVYNRLSPAQRDKFTRVKTMVVSSGSSGRGGFWFIDDDTLRGAYDVIYRRVE